MLTTEREKKICKKYTTRDGKGLVHCRECPLRKRSYKSDFMCKANSHYDRKTGEWEQDEV